MNPQVSQFSTRSAFSMLGGTPTPQEDPQAPKPPSWTPEIEEPDPDLLPDEVPLPNPDENDEPGVYAAIAPQPYPAPSPGPDPQPAPPPGPNPIPNPLPF